MTAREVMDIDEAREKYARGLAISLTDRQIDDQLFKPTPSVSGTPPFGNHSSAPLLSEGGCTRAVAFRRNMARLSSDRLLNDLRGLIGSEQVELEFD